MQRCCSTVRWCGQQNRDAVNWRHPTWMYSSPPSSWEHFTVNTDKRLDASSSLLLHWLDVPHQVLYKRPVTVYRCLQYFAVNTDKLSQDVCTVLDEERPASVTRVKQMRRAMWHVGACQSWCFVIQPTRCCSCIHEKYQMHVWMSSKTQCQVKVGFSESV